MSEPKRYRGRIEDRLVSYASSMCDDLADDETMGMAAQSVAKAAIALGAAAVALNDACLVAASAPSSEPMSGAQRRRIEEVYSRLAQQIQETFEAELTQPLEMLVVIGAGLAPDPEQSQGIRDCARGLGLSTDGLAPSEDEATEEEDDNPRKRDNGKPVKR